MNVLVVNGGMPKGGRTELITRFIAREYGFDYLDINEADLPILTGEQEQWQLPVITAYKEKINNAEGIILISPEYHGGMSGALKNALDFLTSDLLAHKPVALLATAGGGKGGINCLNNMRTVMRGFYANVIPRQLVLDPEDFNYDDSTILEEPQKMVDEMVQELQMYMKMSAQINPPVV